VGLAAAGGVASGRAHLRGLAGKAGDAVRLGEAIGTVGDNPVDNDAAHLHWEVYQGPVTSYPRGTIDPERWLAGARVLPAGVLVR